MNLYRGAIELVGDSPLRSLSEGLPFGRLLRQKDTIHLDVLSAMLRLAPSRHVPSHRGREKLALDLNRSQ